MTDEPKQKNAQNLCENCVTREIERCSPTKENKNHVMCSRFVRMTFNDSH